MNAVLSLSHFCETHGPTVLLSTQAFHFAGEVQSGVLEPFGTEFFGCIQKLKDYKAGISPCIDNVRCEACESVSGYITNDYENKISFLSTRLAIDSNVSFLLKQAAVRSLSCEVVPKKEGKVYFGDSVRGHVLSTTFFLKDSQARGFHRLYSIIVFMRDKHFLLNSWPFFQQHINEMISQLQKKAFSVYTEEQNLQSQRALRLSSLDQKHSSARSLVKLTASTNVFAQLHLWFTWLLSTGARRLEEHVPTRGLDCNIKEKKAGEFILVEEYKEEANISTEEAMKHLRQLRKILGDYDFQRLLYSTLIGRQIVIRGHQIIVSLILSLLQIFLPSEKFRCQKFGDSYQSPGVCNIVGVDISAAVPKPSKTILRLDIIPSQEIGTATITNVSAAYKFYNFIVKNESELPEKLPSLLQKIDKAFSDESLSDSVVGLHVKSLIEEWLHVADVVKEAKKKQSHVCFSTLMRYLGVQEQDEKLIHFWSY